MGLVSVGSVVSWALLGGALLPAGSVLGQPPDCGFPFTGVNMCTVNTAAMTIQCTDFHNIAGTFVEYGANNASCYHTAAGFERLFAVAMTSAPPTRTCTWLLSWDSPSIYTNCLRRITTADGLPVELLEFSVAGSEGSDGGRNGSEPEDAP